MLPRPSLAELRGTVVIDEVQRRPELLRQSSESLAGRLEIVEMAGFSLAEVGEEAATSLWLRDGFPRSWAARSG
jgi:hypothetical protein